MPVSRSVRWPGFRFPLAAVASALALATVLLAAEPESATTPVPQPAATTVSVAPRVLSVGITVSDLDRSVAFFRDVLDFNAVDERESAGPEWESLTGVFGARVRIARMQLGEEQIELWQYLAPEGRPVPIDSRSNDRWFQHIAIVVSDMDAAYARLREHHVRHASTGPQTLPPSIPAAAGISAFYFKDPDGHALEIIQFPEGKGDPRWQQPKPAKLFLGIDHTAIVVQDTEASLRLYRDTLGMYIVGTSENSGDEQEHLNNVEGAHLRITSLKGESGPGVELLEYLTPRDGREYPAEARTNDLISWHTRVGVRSPATVEDFVAAHGKRRVSRSLVPAGQGHSVLVRDADGHLLLLQDHVPGSEGHP